MLTPTSSAEGWPSGVVVLAMHPTVPDKNSVFVQRLEPTPWSPRPSLGEQLAPVDAEDLEEFGCPPPPPPGNWWAYTLWAHRWGGAGRRR